MDHEKERAIALHLFAEPCTGRRDIFHGGNCRHCCLRGEGKPNTADGIGLEPNYAGWQRLYVEAGRIIPAQFADAFLNTFRDSENTSFLDALRDDIQYFGVTLVR